MSEENSSCIEDLCYDCCWYVAKIYTYIQEYLCCCCYKKSIPYNAMETTSIIKENNNYNFDYNFLVIEIKVNNKNYVLNNYKDYMIENEEFLNPDFVYNYLENKNVLRNRYENYTICIMDNKSNFVTLDNNSYLLLNKKNYEKKLCNI